MTKKDVGIVMAQIVWKNPRKLSIALKEKSRYNDGSSK